MLNYNCDLCILQLFLLPSAVTSERSKVAAMVPHFVQFFSRLTAIPNPCSVKTDVFRVPARHCINLGKFCFCLHGPFNLLVPKFFPCPFKLCGQIITPVAACDLWLHDGD